MIRPVSLLAVLSGLAALSGGGAAAQESDVPTGIAADLPFTRALGVSGVVSGSLEESALAAGVPAPALAEQLRGLAEAIDLDRDVRDGDHFYVRYERTFSLNDTPLDGGRVLWAELRLSGRKSTVALHRFRPAGAAHDSFWLANGQGAIAPPLRLPLPSYVLSSGFGLRVDPLDQPPMTALGAGPAAGLPLGKGPTRAALPPGLGSGSGGGLSSFGRGDAARADVAGSRPISAAHGASVAPAP